MDKFYIYRPMLDLIGKSEGTDKGDGYNETLSYGAYTGGNVNLVSMTLSQIDALQTKMLAHPKNKWNSSAIGRYQIVRTTMRQIRKTLGLDGKLLFDEAMQDRMACYLLGLRGIDKWLAGRMKTDTLLNNLAAEWASLPKPNGKGRYGGQNAAVTVKQVVSALAATRMRHSEGQPVKEIPVPVPKPTVPESVDQQVSKRTGLWQWITGVFSSGALGLGWLGGMDWQAIATIGGVVIVFLVVLLIMRRQIIGAVQDIRGAVEGGFDA